MRYRLLTDIFPVGYPFLPSEAEVRRKCRQWLDIAHDEYNLLIITGQINQIVDPYLKEYTTVVMHNLLYKEAADPDSDYRLSTTCLEALENDFRRIINNAWSEQKSESMNTDEQNVAAQPIPVIVTAYPNPLEQDVSMLKKEVSRLCRMVEQRISDTLAKFPYIKSDDPVEIKTIEDTMAIYVRGNNPSELCKYLFENEGSLFMKMPKHADTIFSCIIDRWGDQNHITKDGLRAAWRRLRPA